MLSAADLGYRVFIARAAVCSSSDEGHDMLLRLYHTRFSEQIEVAVMTANQPGPLIGWRNECLRTPFSISVRSYQTLHLRPAPALDA